jgi:hypothetical protein
MKKFIAVVLAITALLVLFMGGFSLYNKNKTAYIAEGLCELEGGELHFYFDNQEFVWTLGAGDKIPSHPQVRLKMESNGTPEYNDDEILNYWER